MILIVIVFQRALRDQSSPRLFLCNDALLVNSSFVTDSLPDKTGTSQPSPFLCVCLDYTARALDNKENSAWRVHYEPAYRQDFPQNCPYMPIDLPPKTGNVCGKYFVYITKIIVKNHIYL